MLVKVTLSLEVRFVLNVSKGDIEFGGEVRVKC